MPIAVFVCVCAPEKSGGGGGGGVGSYLMSYSTPYTHTSLDLHLRLSTIAFHIYNLGSYKFMCHDICVYALLLNTHIPIWMS